MIDRLGLTFLALLAACIIGGFVVVSLKAQQRVYTAEELTASHARWKAREECRGRLFYQGSDEEHHYFVFLSIDSWTAAKVLRSEIELEEVKPYVWATSTRADAPFPGHYAVDPREGFRRTLEGQCHEPS